MTARADLHVHSKHSNQAEEWYLRGIQAPECYSEPEDVYRRCREQGMTFVTISDHNSIEGAAAIAHLPGTFLSSELTVRFPEDGCAAHVLALGITESRHDDLLRLRDDVYALARYAHEHDVVLSVAHPFYRVNDLLTLDHLEKLLVLFDRFEARNGVHHRRQNRLLERCLTSLTRDLVERFADRHGLEPASPRPWVKHLTGGSDDHGGFYVAAAYTETPAARTVSEYLTHLRSGFSVPGGSSGTSRRLARSLYAIGSEYCRERFGSDRRGGDPFRTTLEALAGRRQTTTTWFSFLRQALADGTGNDVDGAAEPGARREAATFESARRVTRKALRRALTRGVRSARRGHLAALLAALGELSPALAAAAPSFVATRAHFKDRDLERQAARHLLGSDSEPRRMAWITDTLGEVNGVSHTVATACAEARRRGLALRPVVSRRRAGTSAGGADVLRPVVEAPLPGYPGLKLAVASPLDLLDHLEHSETTDLLISTPGPLGLAGLLAARLLKLRTRGIYHTDFPAYLRELSGDPSLGDWAARYMRWFYGSLDAVYAPSAAYRDRLLELGLAADKILPMPRGVDRERFHPRFTDAAFWPRRGAAEGFRFLYVGRLSREKNVGLLLDAFERFRATGRRATLALVGEGPARTALETRCRGRFPAGSVVFTGVLSGDDLSAAYAGAHLLVFPSVTDTFGNVVVEAYASGLPVLVTSEGGPADVVRTHGAGRIAPPDPGAFSAAMAGLFDDPALLRKLGAETGAAARAHSWEPFLDGLFPAGPETADRLPEPVSRPLSATSPRALKPLVTWI
jgi:glycosyltransferase involved in cell wall biosynthesis